VTHGHFNGQGLWLEVEVGGTKIGCQEILPVPYALSLRPGAVISDTMSYVQLNRHRVSFPSHKWGVYAKAEGALVNYGVYGDGTTVGVFGSSESGTGVSGSSNNGIGVKGSSGTTYGVYGTSLSSDGYGVYGTAPTTGTVGIATAASGKTYGVYGRSDSTLGRGVYGYATADSGFTYGVYGRSDSTSGRGVYGYASATSGTTYGVYGWSESITGTGVYGTAPKYGVYGYASATSGETYGGRFLINSTDGAGVYVRGKDEGADLILGGNADTTLGDDGRIYSDPAYTSSDILLFSNDGVFIHLDEDNDETALFSILAGANTLAFLVDEDGDMTATGSKSAAVDTRKYGTRKMYAIESTEVWFEDFGTAQLMDGMAIIEIDPIFAETVNLGVGYHVFLTPIDGWAPLYVTNKTPTSFEVRDADGKANIAFDYRIVAKRLGYEDLRMELVVLTSEEEER
jgi:hypothetical protein